MPEGAQRSSASGVTARLRLTPYRPRRIAFLRAIERDGSVLKTYAITRDERDAQDAIVAAAARCAFDYLSAPRPACVAAGVDFAALADHGVGFLSVHAAREAVFAVLDVWVGENMLRHHVWAAAPGTPGPFESLGPSDVAMCTWELAVIQHERGAWLRHVLRPDGSGDVAAYVSDVLNAEV